MIAKVARAALACAALYVMALFVPVASAGPAEKASPETQSIVTPLSDDVRPVHIVAELTVDPRADRLQGDVRIEVELVRATRAIRLHGRDLDVAEVDVLLADGTPRPARYRQLDAAGNAEVTLEDDVPVGRATLRFRYSAPIREADAEPAGGAFRARIDGERYVFTRFQTVDARRALPCFDEPRFKIPFALTLRVPAGMTAAANAPVASGRVPAEAPQWQELRFAATPPLPSYLLAWVVGPFEVIDAAPLAATPLRDRAVPVRVLVAKGRGAAAAPLLAVTPQVVTALERRLAQPYPFAKLDLVLVPGFSAGALENAALILYREALTSLPSPVTDEAERHLLNVHAHELAHQWFGNLVTPARWQDVWLSESFATWLADGVVSELRGDPALTDASRAARAALATDARAGVQPLVATGVAEDDIPRLFDSVRYRKGAAVLAMLESHLGGERMAAGVRRIVRRHAGSSVTNEEVMACLLEDASEGSDPILRSYIERPGAPVLTLRSSCRGGRGELLVRQSLPGLVADPGAAAPAWTVPFCFRTPEGRDCAVLRGAEQRIALASCPAWVHGNADARGHYRVSSDGVAMRAVRNAWRELSPEEQVAFVDDAAALYLLGHTSFAALEQAMGLAVDVASESGTSVLVSHALLAPVLRAWESVDARWLEEEGERRTLAAVFASRLASVRSVIDASPELRRRWLRLVRDDPARRALAEEGLRVLHAGPPAASNLPGATASAVQAAPREAAPIAALATRVSAGAIETAIADRADEALAAWWRWVAAPPTAPTRSATLAAISDLRARDAAPLYAAVLDGRVPPADLDGILSALLRGPDRASHTAWLLANTDALRERGASPTATFAPRLASALCTDEAARGVRTALGTADPAAADIRTCAAARRVQRRELGRVLAAAAALPVNGAVRDHSGLMQ